MPETAIAAFCSRGCPRACPCRWISAPTTPRSRHPGQGQFLSRSIYLSLDPYYRNVMKNSQIYADRLAPGDVLVGETVAQVMESRNPDYRAAITWRSAMAGSSMRCPPAKGYANSIAAWHRCPSRARRARYAGSHGLRWHCISRRAAARPDLRGFRLHGSRRHRPPVRLRSHMGARVVGIAGPREPMCDMR